MKKIGKINLIGNCFNGGLGQGVSRYSSEIYNGLNKRGLEIVINSRGDINHLQQPELVW